MYAEVKFKNRLKNVDEVEDICLPEAVHGEPKNYCCSNFQDVIIKVSLYTSLISF